MSCTQRRGLGFAYLLCAATSVGCADPGSASCVTDDDCGVQVCMAERCVVAAGSTCRSNADCPAPSACVASQGCKAGSCRFTLAASGQPCEDDNACTAQSVCNGEGSCVSANGVCACTNVSECPSAPGVAVCQAVTCPAGTCVYTPAPDVSCGGATCVGNTLYAEQRCDASGSCVPASGAPCPARLNCDAGGVSCRTSCTSDTDCLTGLRCDGTGACVDPPCSTAAQCTIPPGNPACYTAACTASTCQYSVANNAVCGGATCVGSTLFSEQRCSGAGACTPASGAACAGNFRCNAIGTQCRTSCSGSQDCATGSSCSAMATCLLNDGQACTMDAQCLHKCLGGSVCGVQPECNVLEARVLAGGVTVSPTSEVCNSYPCTIRYLTDCANTTIGASGVLAGSGPYSVDPWKTTSATLDPTRGLYYVDVLYGNPGITQNFSNIQVFRSGSAVKSTTVSVVINAACTTARVQPLVGGVPQGSPVTSAQCSVYPCTLRYELDCGATLVGTSGLKDGTPYSADPWMTTSSAVSGSYYYIDVPYPDNSTAGSYDLYFYITGKPTSPTNHLSVTLSP